MVRIGLMTSAPSALNRRELIAGLGLAGFGAAALAPAWPRAGHAQQRPPLNLQARPDSLTLRPGGPATPVWSLTGPDLRFRRGETAEIAFGNDLPVAATLDWRGIDGAPAAASLLAQPPLATSGKTTLQLPLRHAGTFLCGLDGFGAGETRPARPRPLVVAESPAVAVDRDEILLIEEWRLRPDGTAVTPGIDPGDAAALLTINGQVSPDIPVTTHQRLRFRLINGSQRTVIAIKFDATEIRVMAIDGQPAEPFAARNGAVVMAPGGRADVFIDVVAPAGAASAILLHDGKEARPAGRLVVGKAPPVRAAPLAPAPPLPSNGLPAQLDLKGAQRVDVPLGVPADWAVAARFNPSAPPAFQAKTGRTMVLTLINRAGTATVFHLHGHHFRLLDRLDDGWKPFWLDTLAVEPGQTQRIAFSAEYPGRYLIEQVATNWAAPRLVRCYGVA